MWGQGNAKRVERRVKSKQGEGMGFLASATWTDKQTDRRRNGAMGRHREGQTVKAKMHKKGRTHAHSLSHTRLHLCVCVCVLVHRVIQRYRAKDNGQRTTDVGNVLDDGQPQS